MAHLRPSSWWYEVNVPNWLDEWQKELMKTEGNICLRSGRQVGKSTVISIKAAEYAASHKNKSILIIASTDRQSQLLFEKVLAHLEKYHKRLIKTGKERPTKHKAQLRNGSIIRSLPTGMSGYGIRGYTVDLLIADEAAFIHEDVWTAVSPMMAATGGNMILLSTPHLKEGYYYECFKDENFTKFHISSEDCERISDKFLKKEKKRMTEAQYAREYRGEFIDELKQFYPSNLIEECITEEEIKKEQDRRFNFYLGVDFAGYGGDENAFVVLREHRVRETLQMVEVITTTGEEIKNNITGDTIDKIKLLENKYDFKQIYVDDGGLGSPIYDMLKQEDEIKRKITALNNASRSVNQEQRKKILKHDLHGNLLNIMERKNIKLLDDEEVRLSLKSIICDYTEQGNLKIEGSYSHITEALVRAAWGAREKHLNLWIK